MRVFLNVVEIVFLRTSLTFITNLEKLCFNLLSSYTNELKMTELTIEPERWGFGGC